MPEVFVQFKPTLLISSSIYVSSNVLFLLPTFSYLAVSAPLSFLTVQYYAWQSVVKPSPDVPGINAQCQRHSSAQKSQGKSLPSVVLESALDDGHQPALPFSLHPILLVFVQAARIVRIGDRAKAGAMPASSLSLHWRPLTDTTV